MNINRIERVIKSYLRSQTLRRLSVPLEARMVSLWGDHWTCQEHQHYYCNNLLYKILLHCCNRILMLPGRFHPCVTQKSEASASDYADPTVQQSTATNKHIKPVSVETEADFRSSLPHGKGSLNQTFSQMCVHV